MAVPRLIVGEELDLHPRHVDTGRTFALASLAADAQIERRAYRGTAQGIVSELTGEGQSQGVGPAARHMLLVTAGPEARTHRARIELAALAVVIAHLDGLGEAAGVVAAAAGRRDLLAQRIGLHVPGRPVENGSQRLRAVRSRRRGRG